jgi:hypothetical protein
VQLEPDSLQSLALFTRQFQRCQVCGRQRSRCGEHDEWPLAQRTKSTGVPEGFIDRCLFVEHRL